MTDIMHMDMACVVDGGTGTLCGMKGTAVFDDDEGALVTCARCCERMLPYVHTCLRVVVQHMRIATGLTQAQLGALTGLHEMTVSKIERGSTSGMDLATIMILAWGLGTSANTILGAAEAIRTHCLDFGQRRWAQLYASDMAFAVLSTKLQEALSVKRTDDKNGARYGHGMEPLRRIWQSYGGR